MDVGDLHVIRTRMIDGFKYITVQLVLKVPHLSVLSGAASDIWIASGGVKHPISGMDDEHLKAVFQHLHNKAKQLIDRNVYEGCISGEFNDKLIDDVLDTHPSWSGIVAEYRNRDLASQRFSDRQRYKERMQREREEAEEERVASSLSREDTADAAADEDHVDGFLGECCRYGDEMREQPANLFDAYQRWCVESDEQALKLVDLRRIFEDFGIDVNYRSNGIRYWRGVQLKTESDYDIELASVIEQDRTASKTKKGTKNENQS